MLFFFNRKVNHGNHSNHLIATLSLRLIILNYVDISTIIQEFITGIKQTTLPEFVAVVTGITCVFFSKKENILVYPIGLISTVIYTYISLKGSLFGEVSVNVYYTIMSIYGWILWTKKDAQQHLVVHITKSTTKEWQIQLGIFATFYVVIYVCLYWLKQNFSPGAIPWRCICKCNSLHRYVVNG